MLCMYIVCHMYMYVYCILCSNVMYFIFNEGKNDVYPRKWCRMYEIACFIVCVIMLEKKKASNCVITDDGQCRPKALLIFNKTIMT